MCPLVILDLAHLWLALPKSIPLYQGAGESTLVLLNGSVIKLAVLAQRVASQKHHRAWASYFCYFFFLSLLCELLLESLSLREEIRRSSGD